MPQQGVTPRFKIRSTPETPCPLVCGPDMAPALPLPSEVSVAHAATPLLPDVVERRGSFTTALFRGG